MKTKAKAKPKPRAKPTLIAGVDVRKVAKEPVDQRLDLIEALQQQLFDEGWEALPKVTPELAAFLDARLADEKANPDDVHTWEEVLAHIKRRRS